MRWAHLVARVVTNAIGGSGWLPSPLSGAALALLNVIRRHGMEPILN